MEWSLAAIIVNSKIGNAMKKTSLPGPILTTSLMRQCDATYIAWWSMPLATPEATGCCHGVSIHIVSPRQPPGQQQTKQQ